jgi:hypothetical protein
MSERKRFNAFAGPPQLEFLPRDRRIVIRSGDKSSQQFLLEVRLRRHRQAYLATKVQLASSSDKPHFGK